MLYLIHKSVSENYIYWLLGEELLFIIFIKRFNFLMFDYDCSHNIYFHFYL